MISSETSGVSKIFMKQAVKVALQDHDGHIMIEYRRLSA